MNERTGIGELKGIGPKTESLFRKLGVSTVGDLIRDYPRGYDVYEEPVLISELEEGKVQTVRGVICGKVQVSPGKKTPVTTAQIKDMTGTIKAIWFRMPFLRNTLSNREEIILRGNVIKKKDSMVIEHPEIFFPASKYREKARTLQPRYGLTSGLTNAVVVKAVKTALEQIRSLGETLPEELIDEYHLLDYDTAVRSMHFPVDKMEYAKARERLVFEEFLGFILTLRSMKESNDKARNQFKMKQCSDIEAFIDQLPYELTGAQKRVWNEIQEDLTGEYSMSRLVQGDVGSGKTILAVLGLLMVAYNGYQGAMMAPTEVLAKQHYESICRMFEQYHIPFRVELLTGSMTAKEKREAYERIELGVSRIIIGTHALIQEKVQYESLALVVTDEQHRFGVRQREVFAEKGFKPHVLVMSATPIPRTLAIILYGDLDISVVDELPSNRLPIKNCVVGTDYRATAYRFIERQLKEGRQCYIICPMVEESETIEGENVIEYTDKIRKEFPSNRVVEYLHGKMKQSEKDEIMERFSRNEIQILVSTTVIEVGIDVPNSTVILIENAERFGLAQLHQLRGRVGRGKHQSYCIFMSGSNSEEKRQRLEILNKTNDGFKVASEDLKLRGPGDLFGIRQSGILDFKLGDIYQDARILQKANAAAIWMSESGDERIKEYVTKNVKTGVVL